MWWRHLTILCVILKLLKVFFQNIDLNGRKRPLRRRAKIKKSIWLLSCPWLGKLSLFACLTNVMELVFAQKTFSEKSYCNGSKKSLFRMAIALRSFQLLKLHLKLRLVCDVFAARFIEFLVCLGTMKNNSHITT